MDFFNFANPASKRDETELTQRKRHEYHFVGKERKVPGHIMFEYNTKSFILRPADVIICRDVSFSTRKPVFSDRIDKRPDCIYIQALNRKNAIKKLTGMGHEKIY